MKKILLFIMLATVILSIAIVSYFSNNNIDPVSKSEYYLNTFCTITIYDMENMSVESANVLIDDAFYLCGEYENKFSKTIANSDVSILNDSPGQVIKVDVEVADLIRKSQEISLLTDGAFDITIGAVSELWDFHSPEPKLPDENSLQSALSGVGYGNVIVEGNEVSFTNSETKIDLGGIAKGYIADKIAEFLFGQNVTSAIVNFGGNVVTLGEKSGGEGFSIGVERPFVNSDQYEGDESSRVIGNIKLSDQTVVVSGIYQRNFIIDGKLYHHILDPKTGYPVSTEWESVAVIGPRGESVMCDALSTAFLMMGEEKSLEILSDLDGYGAIFIGSNGEFSAVGVDVY